MKLNYFKQQTIIEWLRLSELSWNKTLQPISEEAYCAMFIATRQDLFKEFFSKISEVLLQQAIISWNIDTRCLILQHWRSWFIQQMDLMEVYNWLTETESTVMAECHASRGVVSAKAAIEKHSIVESIVSHFQASRLRCLSRLKLHF